MTKKLEALRGMEDILPGEVEKWQWIEERARIFFEARGFKEIRTPILEYTELFTRSVGETSDIVSKEMFSFQDRGDRHVTLRPEMTASVARAVIEHGLLTQAKSLRVYYLGPMFRAERPQAGRKRQFHQIGIEIINETGWEADLECVTLLYDFLTYTGLQNLKLKINDLGSVDQQKESAQSLRSYFEGVKGKLCKDCQWRIEKNVLRVFDCKAESCHGVIDQAPWDQIAPLGEDFKMITQKLSERAIPFEIKRRLVRGLDYYNGLVFEVTAKGLGAQDSVAGGGRYDRLYSELGGSSSFCTGFSIGQERLIASLESQDGLLAQKAAKRKVYLAPLEDQSAVITQIEATALSLREHGLRIETQKREFSLSKHLKKANAAGARFILILGADELKNGSWTVKDMDTKEQHIVSKEELFSFLMKQMH
ncbi:MAG: histidine--tRNA ligase [Candidatus Omnitrophica bacterium]|nr:histidine--tRNA ligase [Candidatus Omnitrophota bacterium]